MQTGLRDQSLIPLKFSLNENSAATIALSLALTSELWIREGRDYSHNPGSWSVPLALCLGPAPLASGPGESPSLGLTTSPCPLRLQPDQRLPSLGASRVGSAPAPRKARRPGAGSAGVKYFCPALHRPLVPVSEQEV